MGQVGKTKMDATFFDKMKETMFYWLSQICVSNSLKFTNQNFLIMITYLFVLLAFFGRLYLARTETLWFCQNLFSLIASMNTIRHWRLGTQITWIECRGVS